MDPTDPTQAQFAAYRARDVASTLVHEMVHLWQYEHGTPKRAGYHDGQWAQKMEDLGLVPSSTGAPGGRRVGYKMSHYIREGGPFARAFDAMPPGLTVRSRFRATVLAERPSAGRPHAGRARRGGKTAYLHHLAISSFPSRSLRD